MKLETFLFIWFIVGILSGLIATIALCKDDKKITLGSILIGFMMSFGGIFSFVFTVLSILELDYCFYRFKK